MPFSEEHPDQVAACYEDSGERRKIVIPGQKMTYAPRDGSLTSDNTTIDTKALYFGALSPPSNLEYGKFVPTLLSAQVSLPSVEQITGSSTPTFISFYPKYLADGLTNAGGVFAQIADAAGNAAQLPLGLAADKAGGISTPNAMLTSLSRQFGPLAGDIEDAAKNLFDRANRQPSAFEDEQGRHDLHHAMKADIIIRGFDSEHFPAIAIDGDGRVGGDGRQRRVQRTGGRNAGASDPPREPQPRLVALDPSCANVVNLSLRIRVRVRCASGSRVHPRVKVPQVVTELRHEFRKEKKMNGKV